MTYQHMEEFLIGTGKKEPVTLRLEKTEQTWDHLDTYSQRLSESV